MKNITSGQFKMIAKTQQGLEPLLEKELQELGAQNTQRLKRAVSFEGDKRLMYKVNLHSRLALKILLPFYSFKARNDRELYDAIGTIDWSMFLDVNGSLAIDGLLRSDYFNHSQYIALKAKDAIVDQFRTKFNKRPNVDIVNPDLRLNLHIFQDSATLSLDSSNDSLHRRGYREDANKAPLNEVTAAAIVKMTGWNGSEALMDGMCGSGTILIEAAMMAKNVPANYLRKRFGFQSWLDYDHQLWQEVKQEGKAGIKDIKLTINGSDISWDTLQIAKSNIDKAGLTGVIKLDKTPFENLTPNAERGCLIMNPPYGERLALEEANAFYKMIGDKFKKDFSGWQAWVLSSNQEAMKSIRLKTSQRLLVFNGPLECKFHQYEMYQGTKRVFDKETK
ncbi:MAG: THUMP domain-containing class I SAM-dependent RNA methyltransferase, partial [Bacteroidia bacterium]